MNEFLLGIQLFTDTLAGQYNLDLKLFFLIYLISFIPFYLGYFLILYGSSRNLRWHDILKLNLVDKIKLNNQSKIGIIIHLFGRIMPYAYILFFGRNLSMWFYIIVLVCTVLAIFLFVRKFLSSNVPKKDESIKVLRKDYIDSSEEIEKLWGIYNETFIKINKLSPCKQSFDYEHFVESLKDITVRKYILSGASGEYIGLGFITNDFKNTPWISEDYFKFNYPKEFAQQLIYYFIGIAVSQQFRGRRYSISLIEHIVDDTPVDSIIGFDHSRNINPMLHHFTRIIKQSHFISRKHIDRQHYHVVQRKK